MHNLTIKIGADPELFARNKAGALVSAHNLIPGTKQEPHPVKCGAIQVDGTALEFNIDASATADQFVTNIKTVLGELQHYVPDLSFAFEPAVHYPPEYFMQLPELARELGCNPDFNAWTGDENPPPNANSFMRTASGHVHIGWCHSAADEAPLPADQQALVRQLDYYLGLMSLKWDPDNQRRELYGKAGAFRPKPYGVEYRVLSNRWISSEDLMRRVFAQTMKGVNAFFNGDRIEDDYGMMAQMIINNNMTDWDLEVPDLYERIAA